MHSLVMIPADADAVFLVEAMVSSAKCSVSTGASSAKVPNEELLRTEMVPFEECRIVSAPLYDTVELNL